MQTPTPGYFSQAHSLEVMMSVPPRDVAIIGAGLAGTALALSLHKSSIPVRIYEARLPSAPELASGVVLTPNGLSVLSALGVLDRIRSRCWQSEFRTYKNDRDETVRKSVIANEALYGFKNHRLYRRLLLREMRAMLEEAGVRIFYESRFEGVLDDSAEEVTFRINGRDEKAALLVGADGIYSSVRRFLSPDTVPEYTGVIGVLSHIPRSSVAWPYPEYEKACTIQGAAGAIFFIPEVADGSEIMVGMQKELPDLDRKDWEAMGRDKEGMCEFYREGYEQWGGTARSIIDAVCARKETLFLWPFLRMPRLDRWFSKTGRVVLVGDAAHAVPPSSGQGVNQALEDVYSLTLLLESVRELREALAFWQELRQRRIDAVYEWAVHGNNVQRLPEKERERLVREGKASSQDADDMRWLYRHGIDEAVEAWVKAWG